MQSVGSIEYSDISSFINQINDNVGISMHHHSSRNCIYEEAKMLLSNKEIYDKMSKASNPYGDGHASERIVDAIIEKYSK